MNQSPVIKFRNFHTEVVTKLQQNAAWVRFNGLPTVRKQLKNYQRMKLLMEKWIDLVMELSILRLAKKTDEIMKITCHCPVFSSTIKNSHIQI
jgi:hypothetical protein